MARELTTGAIVAAFGFAFWLTLWIATPAGMTIATVLR